VAAFPKIELTIAPCSQPPLSCGQFAHQNEPVVTSKRPGGRPFLTESAPQLEFVLTRSKQTTEKFLTEARTHIRIFKLLPFPAQNLRQLIQRHLIYLGGRNPKNSATVNLHPSPCFTRASLRFDPQPRYPCALISRLMPEMHTAMDHAPEKIMEGL
jgi:hypothetical protein